jgi:hypothetical protein
VRRLRQKAINAKRAVLKKRSLKTTRKLSDVQVHVVGDDDAIRALKVRVNEDEGRTESQPTEKKNVLPQTAKQSDSQGVPVFPGGF